MKFIIETKKKKWHLHFGLYSFEDSKEVLGFTNKCNDSQYIPLLDFDNTYLEDVLSNKRFLEEKYGIRFRYLIKTGKGWHLISLDKVPYHYLREILYDSLCDPMFVRVPFETYLKSSTLRLSEKKGQCPELMKQFPMGKSEFIQSYGHYEMLRKAHVGLLKPEGKFDDTSLEDVQVVRYWTKP